MRRPDPFDRRSMAASAGLHLALLVVAWLAGLGRPQPMAFEAIQIDLYSPPPTVQAEIAKPAAEELVVETPDPTPPPPVEEAPEPEPPKPEVKKPEEKKPEPKPEPKPTVETAEKSTPATTTDKPATEAAESGEDIRVRFDGVRRDFPDYYSNIVTQITRCFRPPTGPGNWTTAVFFVIQKDGATTGIDFSRRSGNNPFDFAAMEAIECAGRRFGPLPDAMGYPSLPVIFDFKPSGDGRGLLRFGDLLEIGFPIHGPAAEAASN